ncbi:uncharacterized protein LOC128744324 [Sabethes cyaneus]|uniref:uncharacterized protein LOC128744324 n=1 Tax=Sabethes cyaneus TaxID=53552 RepID=UPI00237E6449|nr:uncharacterized protein LOC128744324 [Sabethes cyaneus]
MLCRRMRLTERHIQAPREPIEGPIIRPCTARKLEGNDREATICTLGNHGRKSTEKAKTPLMIVNLNIPPGIKTLAPKSLKCSRKLPPFCVQHQQPSKGCGLNQVNTNEIEAQVCTSTAIPQIFIQGFEIQDKKHIPIKQRELLHCEIRPIAENEEDSFANILLDSISNISLEMINRHQQRLQGTTSTAPKPVNKTNAPSGYDMFLNLDSYEIDDCGPLSDKTEDLREDSPPIPAGYRSLCYRAPSPSTRQIIRVNVTMNKDRNNAENCRFNH